MMVGGDHHGIVGGDDLLQPSDGLHALPLGVFPGRADFRDMRIVVGNLRAESGEAVEQFEGRRLAHVIDIGLVGEAEDENPAAFDGFALVVEGDHGALDDVFGHRAVDLAGEFDEAGVNAEFAGFPGEIEGIDGDAGRVPDRTA